MSAKPTGLMSETDSRAEKGYDYDTFAGGFPVTQVIKEPANAAADAVLAAEIFTEEAHTVTAGITDPDVYRVLSITGSVPGVDETVTIHGKDWAGRNRVETITANDDNTVDGNLPFKSIDKIVFGARSDLGHAASVGTTNKFGLYRRLAQNPTTVSGVELIEQVSDGALLFASAQSAANSWVQPDATPDGSESFKVSYLTDVF